MANAVPNWRLTGQGLQLGSAKEVARELDVVLKGSYVDAVDGPSGFHELHGSEDHVIVHNEAAAKDFIKFANFQRFADVCMVGEAQRNGGTLVVVIMPYSDLNSCGRLQELDPAAAHYGYARIELANSDMLLWKHRASNALKDEVAKCGTLNTRLDGVVRELFPANKYRKHALPLGEDRRIAKERLLKAHLDAKKYGDAHQLMLLIDRPSHDAIFRAAGCYDPCLRSTTNTAPRKLQSAANLEAYKVQLQGRLGTTVLHAYPEQSDVLNLEAQYKYRRDMADARRQIQDIIDTAQDEITRIGQTLLAMGDQPSLLGCGI
jgi:hypothetical protein